MSQRTIRYYLGEIFSSVAFWTLSFLLFDLIRNSGLSVATGNPFDWQASLEIVAVTGFVTGVIYAGLEQFFELEHIKRKSYGYRLSVKTCVFLGIFLVDILLGAELLAWLNGVNLSQEMRVLWDDRLIFAFLIYFILCSVFFSFWKIALEKFGPGVFWKMLFGMYTPPRRENKIFMFLDLKDSTAIAEKIGFQNFSQLIQDCFLDLNKVIFQTRAEIYSYVGDEAILMWDFEKGINDEGVISLYYDFMQVLNHRSEYYQKKYGLTPFFKAGAHGGELVAAEVGVVKKDISYLGDVMNTTARIQGLCNTLQEPLLVSEQLYNQLSPNTLGKYSYVEKGIHFLKGKQEEIKLYGVALK